MPKKNLYIRVARIAAQEAHQAATHISTIFHILDNEANTTEQMIEKIKHEARKASDSAQLARNWLSDLSEE